MASFPRPPTRLGESRTTTRVATPLLSSTAIIYYCKVADIKNRNITCVVPLFPLDRFACTPCTHHALRRQAACPSAVARSPVPISTPIRALNALQTFPTSMHRHLPTRNAKCFVVAFAEDSASIEFPRPCSSSYCVTFSASTISRGSWDVKIPWSFRVQAGLAE